MDILENPFLKIMIFLVAPQKSEVLVLLDFAKFLLRLLILKTNTFWAFRNSLVLFLYLLKSLKKPLTLKMLDWNPTLRI